MLSTANEKLVNDFVFLFAGLLVFWIAGWALHGFLTGGVIKPLFVLAMSGLLFYLWGYVGGDATVWAYIAAVLIYLYCASSAGCGQS